MEGGAWLLWVVFAAVAVLWPPAGDLGLAVKLLLLAVGAYLILLFHFLLPRFAGRPWFHYLQFTIFLPLLLVVVHVLNALSPVLDILVAIHIIVTVMVLGRRAALLGALMGSASIFILDDYGTLPLPVAAELLLVRLLSFGLIALLVWTAMERTIGEWRAVSVRAERQSRDAIEQLHETRTLYELATAVGSSLDLREVLTLGVRKTIEALRMEAGFIGLVMEGTPEVRLEVHQGLPQSLVDEFTRSPMRAGEGLVGLALKQRQPIFCQDMSSDPRVSRPSIVKAGYRSTMIIPLTVGAQVIGVVGALSPGSRHPEAQQLSFAQAIGEQVALALVRARYFAQEQRQRELAQTLSRLAHVLGASLDLNSVLDSVLDELQRTFNYRSAALLLLHGRSFEVRASRGHPPGVDVRSIRFDLDGDTYLARVVRDDKPVVIPDTQRDPHWEARPGYEYIRSWAGVPLWNLGVTIGMLSLDFAEPDAVQPGQVELLAAFATQSAAAIERAQLFQNAQRRLTQLSVLTRVAQAISSALELGQVLRAVHAQVERLMEHRDFYIALYDAELDEVDFVYDYDKGRTRPGEKRRGGNGLTEYVIRTSRPLLIKDDFSETAASLGIRPGGSPARSWMGVPLLNGEHVVGVMAVQNYERSYAFDDEDLELFQTLGDQVALAIENARLYERERQGRQQMLLVNRVARRILSINNLNALTQEIASAVVESLGHRLVATFLREGDELVMKGRAGPMAGRLPPDYRHPIDEGMFGLVARTGQSRLARDVVNDPRSVDRVHIGIRSEVVVPLRNGVQVMGVLAAASDTLDAFSAEDVTALETVADQAAQAIANVRAYEVEQRRAHYMQLVAEIGSEIAALLDLNDLLRRTALLIQQRFSYHTVNIFLADERQTLARLAAAAGDEFLPVEAGLELRIGEQGLIGQALRERRPILVNDVRRNPAYFEHPLMTGIASELVVPIRVAERMLGALDAQDRRRDAFGDDDLQIMQTLANQLAAAITNAELHAALERQARTDSVTGVCNHGYFLQRLQEEIESDSQAPRHLALIMLDIDHFKQYNDRYGHVMGDRVLQATAQAIRQNVKRSDVVGRWGGEEFGVALPNTTAEQALLVAERIRDTLAHFPLDDEHGQSIEKPTVSQGIAVFPDHAHTLAQLVDLADRMLYQAKDKGRDQIVPYQPERLPLLLVAADVGR